MRKFIGILGYSVLLAGYASHTSRPQACPAKPAATKPVITPDFQPVGKVARLNRDGQFHRQFSRATCPRPRRA